MISWTSWREHLKGIDRMNGGRAGLMKMGTPYNSVLPDSTPSGFGYQQSIMPAGTRRAYCVPSFEYTCRSSICPLFLVVK